MTTYQKIKKQNNILKKELIILSTYDENQYSKEVEEIKLKWKLYAQMEHNYMMGTTNENTDKK